MWLIRYDENLAAPFLIARPPRSPQTPARPLMNVTFACPACEATVRQDLSPEAPLHCPHCEKQWPIPAGAVHEGRLERCVVCPSTEVYLRKDFPQGLGVTIVAIGLTASTVPWYYHNWYGWFAILLATAMADMVLYFVMGDMLQCYRCHAQYRGVAEIDQHAAFDLEIHERHRQLTARLQEQQLQTQLAAANTPANSSSPDSAAEPQ